MIFFYFFLEALTYFQIQGLLFGKSPILFTTLGGQKVPQKLEAPKAVNNIRLLPKSTPKLEALTYFQIQGLLFGKSPILFTTLRASNFWCTF